MAQLAQIRADRRRAAQGDFSSSFSRAAKNPDLYRNKPSSTFGKARIPKNSLRNIQNHRPEHDGNQSTGSDDDTQSER